MGNYCTIKLREKMAEVANSKAYLSYDDRTMSIKVNKFERNYSEKSHFIVTKKLRDYLDNAISSQIPNLGSVFTMEVSNSGYYVYARPSAEQMNKVNSFGKQLKDQEEVREHILLNQESGNQYFDDEGNVLSKDDYLTYKGQNIQPVDISTLSKETQKVFGFLKENFHRIANNLDIFNDQDIWDEIVGKTKWKNSGGIFTIHDETGQLGIFLNPKKQNPETFPHELLHAFTEIILKNPQTQKEHDFVNLVNDLYEEFKNTPNSKNLNRGYQYKDISEFLTYSLTNTEMQEFIKNNENKKISNLYEKVISFFKKLFGLNDSQFEKLFKSLKLAVNDSDYNNIKERSLSILKDIKGQEISDNIPLIKEDISELFEQNPELANAVYESLGIPKIKLYRVYNTDANGIVIEGQEKYKGQWFTSDLDYALSYIEKNKKVIKGKNVTDNKYDYSGLKVDIIELNPSEAKKYLLSKETIYNEKLDVEPDNFIIPKDVNRSQTINLGEKIGISDKVVKSFLQIDKDKYKQFIPLPSSSTFNNINQQEQQAQQLYSQYLEQNPNGSVEQFKSWVDEFNSLNKKDYSLIRNIELLKEGDFIQEDDSVAKIVNIDKESQRFDFILIDDLNNIESNNYNWYKDFLKSGQHKIKKATNENIEKFVKSEQILKAIYDKNKNVAKSSKGNRFLANFLGYDYNENKILTEYLNSTKKIDALDVLSIIEKTDNGFKYIAKIIKDIIINNNYEISITQNNKKEGVAGDYIDGKINMYIPTNDSQYARVIIHELLHAISDNNVFQHKIDKLYNYVTKFLKDNDIDYGLKNNREFLAEIFSNKVFQELMAQFEYSEPNQNKKLSVLDKFLELLSSFFKIENNSVLKEAFLILEDISKYNTLNTNNKNQDFLFSKKLNSLSDFITRKSQEKLKAIQEIFNSSPELSKVGDVFSYAIYLDTIFPDSKVIEIDNSLYISVLNQLEQENIIEKDCTGGKLKAEKGLQTNFTKGGEWKIYEIFEGKSHKQGGIDINIKNNQISFTNKNGSIKAKYGLVISKDN